MEKEFITQGFYLLVTSLLAAVVALVVYIWHGARRDDNNKMSKLEKCVESHNNRLLVLETEHDNNHCRKGDKERRKKK